MMRPYSIERRRGATSFPVDVGSLQDLGSDVAAAPEASSASNAEVLAAIKALEAKIDAMGSPAPSQDVEDHSAKIDIIQTEIADISGRIRATKAEIAALRHPLSDNDKFELATAELSQIVQQTESATEKIMNSGEKIEEAIADVMTQISDEYLNGRLGDVSDEITKIYESCNFQDLTGQRITKVIKVLNYIEERVDSMLSAWNIKEFETMPLPDDIIREDEGLKLAGPAAEEQADTMGQDDIDALFD